MKQISVLLVLFMFMITGLKANELVSSEYFIDDSQVEALFETAGTPVELDMESVQSVVSSGLNMMAAGNDQVRFKPSADDQVIAIVLCWFFGGIAVHRVYLGSTPWMILYYFITCGGIFGIVPLIDFFMLIINGTGSYDGSDKFFSF